MDSVGGAREEQGVTRNTRVSNSVAGEVWTPFQHSNKLGSKQEGLAGVQT